MKVQSRLRLRRKHEFANGQSHKKELVFSRSAQSNLPEPDRAVNYKLPRLCSRLAISFLAFLFLSPLLSVMTPAYSVRAQESGDGYMYMVQPGDSWGSISRITGVSVAELQETNPDSMRFNQWLRIGEQLRIPRQLPAGSTTESQTHIVQRGESWSVIAAKYDVSIRLLRSVNPQANRPRDVLLVGDELTIPSVVQAVSGSEETVPTADASAQEETVPTPDSQSHQVGIGDSWSIIAAAYNVSISELKAANPAAIRPGDVLILGEKLEIPAGAAASDADATDAASSSTPDDSEQVEDEVVAEVEPSTVDAPSSAASSAPSSEASSSGAEAEESEDEPEVAETDTSVEASSQEDSTDQTDGEEPTTASDADSSQEVSQNEVTDSDDSTGQEEAASAAADESAEPTCPNMISVYSTQIEAGLSDADNTIEMIVEALDDCSVLKHSELSDWTGDGLEDGLIVLQKTNSELQSPEGDLLIFNALEGGGYELAFQARAAGQVDLLSILDINDDGQPEISWSDTTCGANTCFATVNVRSWDGRKWEDWTEGTLTMARPTISLEDVNPEGDGSEIVMSGGIYGSANAGPQRGRQEVWASIDGAPYTLLELTYDESNCIYFFVIDGNRSFLDGTEEGLAAASTLYADATTNEELEACWQRPEEVNELRSFSQFRLALISAYQGDNEGAASQIAILTEQYPEMIYAKLGQVWLDVFNESGDVEAACTAANLFAAENPESWQLLADYGYINPSFNAEEVCPILDIAVSTDAAQSVAPATSDSQAAEDARASEANEENTDENVEASSTGNVALPTCPDELSGYATAAADAINAAAGDQDIVETWLQECGVLTENYGALLVHDINEDGASDFILFPTTETAGGYGPGGTQGLVLIYHSISEDGKEVEFVAGPDVFGQPVPLGIDDYNDDGQLDLAFMVEGCSSFCVTEVQLLTWNGEVYIVNIAPGATIAEGTIAFEPVADDDPGQGQAIILSGGVSGTPEGGLNVPHTEIWQSVDGQAYQRISWTYDREVEGANCLGLRLIEADIAMQAAESVGYEEVIALYTAAIDPTLEACSIHGTPAADELILLQGLASFRLVQAQLFNGDQEEAATTLEALSRGQPDGVYANMAKQWAEEFNSSGDAARACEFVKPLIEENDLLWQITDHYGYNHPSLAAQQICFIP